jgi:hypothetical protein
MAFSGDGIPGKIACLRLSLLTHRYYQAVTHSLAEKERERGGGGLIFLVIHEWNAGMRARRLLL